MIKKQPDTWTLDELCREVERRLSAHRLMEAQADGRVSAAPDARTIRYYTTLGLIDRPTRTGREARYGSRHLLQILAIKALQGAAQPLGEIQARLYGRSDAELGAILSAIAGERRPVAREIQPLRWHEVTLEPGLKIMVLEGWSPRMDPETLGERIRRALAALSTLSNTANGGKKS